MLAESDRKRYGSISSEVLFDVLDIQVALQKWTKLPIIARAESFEQQVQVHPAFSGTGSFLDHEPVSIHDKQFCTLLNHWKSLKIYITTIEHPTIGPGPVAAHRVPIAIEICRTYAAFGVRRPHLSPWDLFFLNYAGTAFGGEGFYPEETKWVHEKMGDSGAMYILPTFMLYNREFYNFASYKGDYLDGVRLFFQQF
jgi:hypothetical protein